MRLDLTLYQRAIIADRFGSSKVGPIATMRTQQDLYEKVKLDPEAPEFQSVSLKLQIQDGRGFWQWNIPKDHPNDFGIDLEKAEARMLAEILGSDPGQWEKSVWFDWVEKKVRALEGGSPERNGG